MYLSKKKYLCAILILIIALCGCSGRSLNNSHISKEDSDRSADFSPEAANAMTGGDERHTMNTAPDTQSKEGDFDDELQTSVKIPDLDKCEELSTALDMLIVYGVKYNESMQNPDEDFWDGFKSALVCNSWFGPFSDENNTDMIWDNERIAAAGSLITGRELICTCFPDGLDASHEYSPYLAWSSKVNVHIEPLEEDRFEISYDMMWAPVSMTSIDGMIRVSAIVRENQDSPLNGFSILMLDHEEIYSCVHTVFGDFDYDVSEDNDEIHEKLYQLTDGIHTTIDNKKIGKLFEADADVEYVFADINEDLKDDMIIRGNGDLLNFFFYTDGGILWTASPIDSTFEKWFTEDYLLIGKASQPSEDTYIAYQIGSDGTFKQVMLLRNYYDENRERYVVMKDLGEERDISEEEYEYLTEYLESKRVNIDWTKIL